MFEWLFKRKSRSQLGIDLGRSAIKIVELAKKDSRPYLVNYAMISPKAEDLRLSDLKNEDLAEIIKDLVSQAGFSTKIANFSLPVEKTFSTIMEIPLMPEAELAAAIPFEAQKYVPVPIDEVVLDWSVIAQPPAGVVAVKSEPVLKSAEVANKSNFMQILLVAVPKELIESLTRIAKLAGLELMALEQEAFSLARALVGVDSGIYLIADFGHLGTDLIIVDQGIIKMTHSLEKPSKEVILMEIDRVVNVYQMRYNKKVMQCLLTGGHAAEKETFEFLSSKLKIPLKMGEPLARIGHNNALDRVALELGLQLAVPIGLALREN